MVNPEWGTKRVCPNCSVKFYDFNHEQPLTCPSCAQTFTPELLLRSRRGRPLEVDQDDNNEDDEFDGVETDEDEDEDDAEAIKEISAEDAVMPVSGGDDDDDDDIGDDINVGADDSDLDDDDDVLIDDDDDVGVDDDLDDEFDEDETR